MSDYGIKPDDLRERLTERELAQITSDPPGAAPDDSVIDAKITAAEAEIHLATGVYYTTPIAARSDATASEAAALMRGLREKILDLAAYKLLQLRPQILNLGERNTYWSQLKKSIDTWLERISSSNTAKRLLLPVGVERTTGAVTTSGGALGESDENVMTRDALAGWR